MNVEMLENIGTTLGPFHKGKVYTVPDGHAHDWVRIGYARETSRHPAEIEQLLARLDEGAGRPILFTPFIGEFGHCVMSHLRVVHFSRASEKIVCCRPGEEVLYPSAAGFVTNWEHPVPDVFRVGSGRDAPPDWSHLSARYPDHLPIRSGQLTPLQEIHCIEPDERIPFRPKRRGLRADVVLGVRHRAFAPERNWGHWQQVADALTHAGYTFAVIGDRSTSYGLRGQVAHSGDFDTDAAIELLQEGCALYIGQDSGSSHLAATVGARMLVFRETKGGSRDLVGRMRQVNHLHRTELLPEGWDRPDIVAERALQMLAHGERVAA